MTRLPHMPYHRWVRVPAIPPCFDNIYIDASGHIWLAFPTPVLWWLMCADAAPRQMALWLWRVGQKRAGNGETRTSSVKRDSGG